MRPMNAISELVQQLALADALTRESSAAQMYAIGAALADEVVRIWLADPDLARLMTHSSHAAPASSECAFLGRTVGVAVTPENFVAIHRANGAPRFAIVPADQDAREFELHFEGGIHLDILTTKEPGASGAIARFLALKGEGIQQVEYLTADVDNATALLRARFGLQPIYPATREGADGSRVNFFLASALNGSKVLIELVEAAPGR
jgi:hypothetical protein